MEKVTIKNRKSYYVAADPFLTYSFIYEQYVGVYIISLVEYEPKKCFKRFVITLN